MEAELSPYLLLFELEKSDFWEFFNIRITDEKKMGNTTLYYLKPGGHQTAVDLSIQVNQKNQITESILYIKRNWLFGEPDGVNPLALDIVGSFISACVSPTDTNIGIELKMLFDMQNTFYYYQIFKDNIEDPTNNAKIMKVYLGLGENFSLPLKHSNVLFKNQITGSIGRLIIKVNIIV